MVFRLALTNECQCNCFYCNEHVKEGKGEYLPTEHVIELAEKAVELGYNTIELTGGEPLLHPEFSEILKKIKSHKLGQNMVLCTNGILLESYLPEIKDAGIAKITIHQDSVLAEQYKKITGCSEVLNQILCGLWSAIAKKMQVEIRVKLHQYSKEQIGQILCFAKKANVHVRIEDLITDTEKCTTRDFLLRWKSVIGELITVREHVYSGKGWKGTFSLEFQDED